MELEKRQKLLCHEMSLINCKVGLKLKWAKNCVLTAAIVDNVNNRESDNIVFIIKETKLYVLVVTLSQETIKNYQTFLAKDLKDQFTGMNIKQKVWIKIQQINKYIFSNQILFESIDFLF